LWLGRDLEIELGWRDTFSLASSLMALEGQRATRGAVEDAELTTVGGTAVAGCLAMSRYQKPSSNGGDVCLSDSESPYPSVFIAAMPQSQAAVRSGKRSWLGPMSVEPSSH
jgi:hypothetical protein